MTGTGVTICDQYPVDAPLADAGEHPPSAVWERIATADEFQRALIKSLRIALSSCDSARVPSQFLYDQGVTAADGGYARLVTGLDRAPETAVHQRALELTTAFGQDGLSPLGHLSLDGVADGPLAVLQVGDIQPTVAVRIGQAFRERRRDQRERTCRLLAQACDLRAVTTSLLARKHRTRLPSAFSE